MKRLTYEETCNLLRQLGYFEGLPEDHIPPVPAQLPTVMKRFALSTVMDD